jgi:hypothetical protein
MYDEQITSFVLGLIYAYFTSVFPPLVIPAIVIVFIYFVKTNRGIQELLFMVAKSKFKPKNRYQGQKVIPIPTSLNRSRSRRQMTTYR